VGWGGNAEMKVTDSTSYQLLEPRGVHDDDSHHPDKDKSKHLKWKQIEANHTEVRISLNQSARQLRSNLINLSPNEWISLMLLRNMKLAKLTLEQLDSVKIDDSFGSLVWYADSKWFPALFEQHNDWGRDFHLNMYNIFVIAARYRSSTTFFGNVHDTPSQLFEQMSDEKD
jgi:hypothetical protein